MFAVFGKSKKKEFENSFNKLGVKIKDEKKIFCERYRLLSNFRQLFDRKDSYGFCGALQGAGRFYPPCLYSNSQASI